jgi:urate oxidase
MGNHLTSFVQSSKEERLVQVTATRDSESIVCGLRNLQILKTSNSAFFGYMQDEYTTLPETRDRLLGTVLDAEWTLTPNVPSQEFNTLHQHIRRVLLDCFATHESLSVQHTLYAMGAAVLKELRYVDDIHLTMPNKHCLLVDLSRLGLDNPNQIFVPVDEPSGYIEARLSR